MGKLESTKKHEKSKVFSQKMNIGPENNPFEQAIHIPYHHFWVPCSFSFWETQYAFFVLFVFLNQRWGTPNGLFRDRSSEPFKEKTAVDHDEPDTTPEKKTNMELNIFCLQFLCPQIFQKNAPHPFYWLLWLACSTKFKCHS